MFKLASRLVRRLANIAMGLLQLACNFVCYLVDKAVNILLGE